MKELVTDREDIDSYVFLSGLLIGGLMIAGGLVIALFY